MFILRVNDIPNGFGICTICADEVAVAFILLASLVALLRPWLLLSETDIFSSPVYFYQTFLFAPADHFCCNSFPMLWRWHSLLNVVLPRLEFNCGFSWAIHHLQLRVVHHQMWLFVVLDNPKVALRLLRLNLVIVIACIFLSSLGSAGHLPALDDPFCWLVTEFTIYCDVQNTAQLLCLQVVRVL